MNDALVERVVHAVHRGSAAGALPPFAWDRLLTDGERREAIGRMPSLDALPTASDGHDVQHLDALRTQLVERRASVDPIELVIANAIATACFGRHHLWEDLGAGSRRDVSTLLHAAFPALAAGNTRDLRWKRYLFRVLGATLGIDDLRPPHCDGCDDFDACFGTSVSRDGSTRVATGR